MDRVAGSRILLNIKETVLQQPDSMSVARAMNTSKHAVEYKAQVQEYSRLWLSPLQPLLPRRDQQ